MKKILRAIVGPPVLALQSLIPQTADAQVSVISSNGYAVNVMVLPVAVLPSTTNCPYGFNYNLRLNYTVTFTGINIPASLYTLQGFIGCGSTQNFFDLPNNGGVGTVNSTSNPWVGTATCNVATILSLGCTAARIEISGPGIPAQNVNFSIVIIPLPVTFASFSISQGPDQVRLAWQTASENNSNYFVIERSTQGTDWDSIGTVTAAGQSAIQRNYTFPDNAPVNGNSFYRLKIVDLDGRAHYSEVRASQFNGASKGIRIFPVPNSGNHISFQGLTDAAHQELTITSAGGAVVYTSRLQSPELDLPRMTAGVYLFTLRNVVSGETAELRYLKQ